jgi:hypothetical protein
MSDAEILSHSNLKEIEKQKKQFDESVEFESRNRRVK